MCVKRTHKHQKLEVPVANEDKKRKVFDISMLFSV